MTHSQRFDGILIASDWDGTLSVDGEVSEKNRRAIRKFQFFGGYFTVISGRTPAYLTERFCGFAPNTYTVGLNGARIEDLRTGEILYSGTCDAGMLPALRALLSYPDGITSVIAYRTDGVRTMLPEEARKTLPDMPPQTICKTVFITKTPEDAAKLLSLAAAVPQKGYEVVRSFPTGVELLAVQNGKGAALLRLKKALGVRCAIGVGDFENDLSLLAAADIGYAVKDAVPKLLAVADRVVCPAKDGAIAAVIEDIKKRGV